MFPLKSIKDILTCQDPVKGRGGPTSLHVAQDGHPGVKTQAANYQLDMEEEWSGTTVRIQYVAHAPCKIYFTLLHLIKFQFD